MSIAQKEPDFAVPSTATRPPRGRTAARVDPAANGRPDPRTLTLGGSPVILVGLSEIKDLFAVTKGTVYRWHTERYRSGTALPPPLLTVSRSPLWPLDQVLEFAAARGHKPKPAVLARIKRAQGQ